MNNNDDKLEYLDLFLAYLNNELNTKLSSDIKQALAEDYMLNIALQGLYQLYQDTAKTNKL